MPMQDSIEFEHRGEKDSGPKQDESKESVTDLQGDGNEYCTGCNCRIQHCICADLDKDLQRFTEDMKYQKGER